MLTEEDFAVIEQRYGLTPTQKQEQPAKLDLSNVQVGMRFERTYYGDIPGKYAAVRVGTVVKVTNEVIRLSYPEGDSLSFDCHGHCTSSRGEAFAITGGPLPHPITDDDLAKKRVLHLSDGTTRTLEGKDWDGDYKAIPCQIPYWFRPDGRSWVDPDTKPYVTHITDALPAASEEAPAAEPAIDWKAIKPGDEVEWVCVKRNEHFGIRSGDTGRAKVTNIFPSYFLASMPNGSFIGFPFDNSGSYARVTRHIPQPEKPTCPELEWESYTNKRGNTEWRGRANGSTVCEITVVLRNNNIHYRWHSSRFASPVEFHYTVSSAKAAAQAHYAKWWEANH